MIIKRDPNTIPILDPKIVKNIFLIEQLRKKPRAHKMYNKANSYCFNCKRGTNLGIAKSKMEGVMFATNSNSIVTMDLCKGVKKWLLF